MYIYVSYNLKLCRSNIPVYKFILIGVHKMKKGIMLVAAILVAICCMAACSNAVKEQTDPIVGTWKLTEVWNYDTKQDAEVLGTGSSFVSNPVIPEQ
jgi:hypothetical protein